MMLNRRTFLTAAGLSALAARQAFAAPPGDGEDWPCYRGPRRDGTWTETGIVEKFAGPEIPAKWKTPVSNGYSGPTIANGRVYLTDLVLDPAPMERVRCFNAETGAPLWTHAYPCLYAGFAYTNGPRASVTIHNGRAYSMGSMGHFHCLDAATGKLVWKHECQGEYQVRMPDFGIAAEPLIDEDRVVVHIGGADNACLVAFDQATGKERWRSLPDRAGYSAPVLIQQAGRRVMAVWTGDHVAGLDPVTGKPLWQYPIKSPQVLDAFTPPIVDGDRLFVSGWHSGALMLRLVPDKLEVEKTWYLQGPNERQTRAFHTMFTAAFFGPNEIFGMDTYGEFRCLDAKTGDRIWMSEAIGPHVRNLGVHFTRHAGEVWIFNELGQLIISRVSRQGFQELSRAQLLRPTKGQFTRRNEGVTWSPPAFSHRQVFARNDEELICASLAAG
jgi:outer membrane protein assembly factor BamB